MQSENKTGEADPVENVYQKIIDHVMNSDYELK